MTSGRAWRREVPNEDVSYHEHNLQDVIIKDLQWQVAELTQRLVAQNMEMYRDIDGRNSKSNFENPYHNHVLVREHHGRDEKFQLEEDVEDHSQCFIDYNSPPTYKHMSMTKIL
jgi:hypothetical protein